MIRGLKRIRKMREAEEETLKELLEDVQDRMKQQEDGRYVEGTRGLHGLMR